MASQIFRKVSLERLSSPEQLDLMVKITTPAGWLSLVAIGILLAAIIFWSIYGSIPTKVTGKGILIKSGGVFTVEAPTAGKVTGIYVNVDSVISKDQIVARIAQPDLLNKINQTRLKLNNVLKEYKIVVEVTEENNKFQLEYVEKEINNNLLKIKQEHEVLKWLNQLLNDQQDLLKAGLITINNLADTKQKISGSSYNIEQYNSQIKNLISQKTSLQSQLQTKSLNYENQISEIKRNIRDLEDDLEISSKVITSYSGRVLEVSVDEDKFVNKGTNILTMELMGQDIENLEGIIYVSPGDGKLVKPGMKVDISPANVKQEEYGFMIGIVTDVSEFPSTTQGMMRLLQNDNLLKSLSGGGAPIEVKVTLKPSLKTFSGYKWSSKDGPPIKLNSGTLCFSSIIVMEQAPVTLVIPLLKKYLLGEGVN